MTAQAFICDVVRTAIGRYAGASRSVCTEDLGAIPRVNPNRGAIAVVLEWV